ncbi:MAG: hypothetical protein HY961_13345 [Ignavibacteriae bacterium]|nr:hypothetical protein [Ignavibacteriota bacterium]
MKNVIIGSIVAAVIVWLYQAMSWMILPVHTNTLKYTPQQDAILSAVTANLAEPGVYAIPNTPPTATDEEKQAFQASMVGKPWALVTYSPSGMSGSMAPQMILGFLINFVAAFVVAYVLWKSVDKFAGFGSKLMLVLGFAVFTVFQSSLMMANWWGTPWHYLSGEVIDHILGWGLAGVWLAWWLGRKPAIPQP